MATERVALVPSVAIAFPRSPMVVANQAWDINRHSKGRFVVGLGSQIKAHNERRFSTPWIAPAARLGEYVEALRAIFRCWETGEKLNYQGKYYNFSLMTPEFSPGPQGLRMPPIAMAAVGPLMLKTAARVADSVRLHSFATRDYLEKVVRPLLAQELAAAGKSFENFEITGGGFVATGPDAAAVKEAAEKVRYRVAFYGSTPAYRGVFDLHGVGDLGVRLTECRNRGNGTRWPRRCPTMCWTCSWRAPLTMNCRRRSRDVTAGLWIPCRSTSPPAPMRRRGGRRSRRSARFRACSGVSAYGGAGQQK